MGMAGYFLEYLPSFATVSTPLRTLLAGKSTAKLSSQWRDEHTTCFKKLKHMLTHTPALALPQYGAEAGKFVLQTDASATGLGAVLYQMQQGIKRPIVYISRSLKKRERDYDTQRAEGLAIVWALERLRHYILGMQFEVHSDHANLQTLLKPQHAAHAGVRGQLARWALAISEYQFTLSYNKKVLAADALSRDPRFDNVPPEPMSRKYLMPRGALDPLDQPEWEPEPGDLATGMCGSARFAAEQPGGIDGLHAPSRLAGQFNHGIPEMPWGTEHGAQSKQ